MADNRAAIAVAALYALLVQAFLVALHPIAPPIGIVGVICAEYGGSPPADEGTPCQQHACCVPAPVAQPTAELVPTAVEAALPVRLSSVLIWRVTAALGPRAPPDPAVSSRGPPTV